MASFEEKIVDNKKWIKNPKTNKWVTASGSIGRSLLGKNICRAYERREGFKPLPHQLRVLNGFLESPYRGICIQHSLGLGKSCSYAMIIDAWLENPDTPKKVIVLTSGSLRENFLNQYCSFCGKNTENLLQHVTFVSYNYTLVMNKLPDLNNSLIVIDEIHNILNGRSNESETVTALYEAINTSKNTRIVVGSGTVIVSNIQELYYLYKLIKPEAFKTLVDFFDMLTIKDDIYYPKDDEKFLKKLEGVLDYMGPVEEKKTTLVKDFPKVTIDNVMVPIHKNIERLRRISYYREIEITTRPVGKSAGRAKVEYKQAKTRYYLAISMLKSRQTSNFLYPSLKNASYLGTTDLLEVIPDEKKKDRIIPDSLKTDKKAGWIDEYILKLLPSHGEKITQIIKEIKTVKGKHVVYTSFKTYFGENLLSSIFKLLNINHLLYDGEMDDQLRNETLQKFNDDENKEGVNYKVLIMTDAGAEGISLLAVRMQHILEQSISEYVIEQVMGRCNRYQSHHQLNPFERTLAIKRYFLDIEAVYPKYKNNIWSPDVAAYIRGQFKKNSISYIRTMILPQLHL
jgi:SNF2 family DNA or RNA helicase